jgi:carbonic anhydrase
VTLRGSGVSRRKLLGLGGLAVAGSALSGCSEPPKPPATAGDRSNVRQAAAQTPQPIPGDAWLRLVVGNDRFAGGKTQHPHQDPKRREELATSQQPFAVVLSCVDSRVAPEIIFDQGLGDLLTVRTAGEALDDAVIGSIEYGVAHLRIPLIVILGHTNCGAVKAAIDLVDGKGKVTGDLATLVRSIEPAVRTTPRNSDPDKFWKSCVVEQTMRTATELKERSVGLEWSLRKGKVRLMTVVYDIQTGYVTDSSVLSARKPG